MTGTPLTEETGRALVALLQSTNRQLGALRALMQETGRGNVTLRELSVSTGRQVQAIVRVAERSGITIKGGKGRGGRYVSGEDARRIVRHFGLLDSARTTASVPASAAMSDALSAASLSGL